MRLAALALSFALTVTQATASDYIVNKGAWERLSDDAQLGYALGALDQFSAIGALDLQRPDGTSANADWIYACRDDLLIFGVHLVEIIETEYETLENWDRPPWAMLLSGLRKVCRNYVPKDSPAIDL